MKVLKLDMYEGPCIVAGTNPNGSIKLTDNLELAVKPNSFEYYKEMFRALEFKVVDIVNIHYAAKIGLLNFND